MIGGVLAGLGSAFAGGLSYYGQKEANKANIASARESMAFQERMSNTSYQRTMEDMRKAGLNPILAARFGGASSPGGAQATSQNELGGAASSAIEVRRMIEELKNLKQVNRKIDTEIGLNNALMQSAYADQRNKFRSTQSQIDLNAAQTANLLYDSVLKKVDADIANTTFGAAMRAASKIPGLSSLVGSAGANVFKKRSVINNFRR